MVKKDIIIGITKEEIQEILDVPDVKIEGLAEAIEKIIARNNELVLKYFEDNIYRIYNEKREIAMRNKGWRPPIKNF